MKTFFPVEPCDDERLRLLLTADETSVEFEAAASHLESCERCRKRLYDLAAGANEWAETRELLDLDETDLSFATECREFTWSVFPSAGGPATTCAPGTSNWTEAMVRQFLAPPSHPEMLGRLGRYEIERLIGAGGMGIVLKGFDTELNRPVAIKVLAPHLAGNGAARQRFAREARAAAAVVHEHVVAIHNVESGGTAPFLVMKLIAGESLQTRIDRQGPLDLCEILRIARQTAAGLAAAHAQGLVHRDVKPSNILLEQGVERALLTDFGLARASDDASLTHTGYMPGTPHYMSPEQARGESVDARSDLFSLGSVIYTMCTGRPPFRAETSFGILRRITDNDPRPIREVNPSMPEWLAAIIAKLHAKSPADRFESAGQLADTLEKCLAHVQQPMVVPLPEEFREKKFKRAFGPALLLSSAAAICVVITLVATKPWQPSATKDMSVDSGSGANPPTQSLDEIDPMTEWETVERELTDLLRDTDQIEPDVGKLWATQTQRTKSSSKDSATTNTAQPGTQEPTE